MRRILLKTLVAVAPLVLAAAGAHAQAQGAAETAPVTVGAPAPDVSLAGPDGRAYRLADLRGKRSLVLVVFRGVW